ncbi:MAG: hypothetical protein Q4G05_03865 [Clostridia bacterium]|nr:hypothetical protein [Clostridia bacterium]
MRKVLYFSLIFLTCISFLFLINTSTGRYKGERKIEFSVITTPFYLEHTGTDIYIPYNSNTAKMGLTVHNYIDQRYTVENLDYQISIDNDKYLLNVNGVDSNDNISVLQIQRRRKKF